MNRIWELLGEKDTVVLFDVDGTLTSYNYGEYHAHHELDFTPEFARLSPAEFLAEAGISRETEVRCGSNWRFGRGGEGDAEWLRARGYRVTVVPSVSYRGEGVSSTRIRAALERGEVEDANAMLGRPFSAAGVPFSGKGEGTRIGCPTVNLRLDSMGIRLPRGAYAAEVCGVRAVANWGVAPTFGTRAWESPVLEVHFLSPVPALPSSRIHVSFLRFIRPERKFDGLDSLRAQIALDCESARA